jgi:hypothetical protein
MCLETYGDWHCPPTADHPGGIDGFLRPQNSVRFDFPMMIMPRLISRSTIVALFFGMHPTKAYEPEASVSSQYFRRGYSSYAPTVVSMPSFSSVIMLSFSTIGMPCSGPLIFPLARSSSSFLAIFNTSYLGATEINALSCLPLLLCISISRRYNRTIWTLVTACAFNSSDNSNAETVSGSKSGSHVVSSAEDVNDAFREALLPSIGS